jgi:nucleoid-associated protein YgaU
MQIRTAVVAAVLVLAAGTGLAMLFHKPASVPVDTARLDEPIRRKADSGPRFLMEVRSIPPPSVASPPISKPARPMDMLTGVPLFEGGGAVPQLARNYPPAEQPKLVEHRVIDGDTLPALAQRYLGDASRAVEIFEANRDVLADPELLPIGAILKMPK